MAHILSKFRFLDEESSFSNLIALAFDFMSERNSATNCAKSLRTPSIFSLCCARSKWSDSVVVHDLSGVICARLSSGGIMQLNRCGTDKSELVGIRILRD